MHYLAYGGRGGGCIGGGMPAKCGGCGGILGGSGIPGLRKIYRRGKNISFISNTQNENSNLFSAFMICNLTLVVAAVRKRAVAASSDAVASFAASSALAHRQRADEVGHCD